MLSDLACGCEVYLVTGYTDMRKGIDGLATIVQGKLSMDPFSRSLYLFCGRNRSKIKGLLWEGDGFLLLYKRLDNGSFRCQSKERRKNRPDLYRNKKPYRKQYPYVPRRRCGSYA